eukprot:gene8181-9624_t
MILLNLSIENMGFFSFLGSLIYYLIKTPLCLVWYLITLIIHPVTILVALCAFYLYYTHSNDKSDIPFISKMASSFKHPGSPSGATASPVQTTTGSSTRGRGRKF